MMAQECKPRLPTPSSPRTPSRRWPAPFNPGRRAGAVAGVFGIACGCVDSKSVAVSPTPAEPGPYPIPVMPDGATDCDLSYEDHQVLRYQRRLSKSGSLSFTTATTVRSTTTSSSSSNALANSLSRVTRSSDEPVGEGLVLEPHRLSLDSSSGGGGSYSILMRQTSGLDNSARDWSPVPRHSDSTDTDESPTTLAHATTGGALDARHHRKGCSSSSARRDAGGSVVVVKDTEDPVGEFQQSMLAMVADRGMTCADQLRELLVWFLALNAPENHGLVLLAFARVCQDVLPNSNPTQRKQRPPTPRRRGRGATYRSKR